ncbi:MAG: hypothetical protein A2Y77_03530 [Planctomycetes bacterium RBG_13_62_9]|nr:MAG: hypothetical protein A2Y77_03530 [Planctomycetes bacterium RBG_13_62_9]
MTQHSDGVRLQHMLAHASEAVDMVRGKRRDDLVRNRMLQLALVRLVEIVGEAATQVSIEGQKRHSSIPWQVVRGMRNRLIHGYDKIDLDVLWDTIEHDLPPLIAELHRILGEQTK